MGWSGYGTFVVLAVVLVLVPGPDVAVVLRNTLADRPWRDVPPGDGKPDTLSRLFRRRTHAGLWMRLLEAPAGCVQYHPEAGPGPNDSLGLFDEFIELFEGARA